MRVLYYPSRLTLTQLSPTLAILLAHDVILSKKGVAAPAKHPLRQAIERHRTRLNGEFTKLRIRNRFPSLEAWRASINSGNDGASSSREGKDEKDAKCTKHPRWVRINTLQTTWEEQKKSTFAEFKEVEELGQILEASSSDKLLHHDRHIPNLLALPTGCDLSKSLAYQKGEIIFQDKASCFPAYLLDPSVMDGAVVDACAAPGNKTTHLAAILASSRRANVTQSDTPGHGIFAFERNKQRTETLRKMVKLAGADSIVSIVGNRDFLTTDPSSHKFWGAEFNHIGALLLDPSCSGSGIVGRDDEPTLFLPSADADTGLTTLKSKKRKRKTPKVEVKAVRETVFSDDEDDGDDEPAAEQNSTATRLTSLSAFQLQLLKHAMKFPDAKKIIYSTCSIHSEENESVVVKALASDIGRRGGWRLLCRDEQVEGLQKWHIRGDKSACESLFANEETNLVFAEKNTDAALVSEACIRCERGTADGTMGFFVAGFVRDERLARAGEL
jgi:putative methyltransferase